MKKIVTATLAGGMRFEAVTQTGHLVVMDAASEAGGENTGARPYDMLLVGLAGCTGMDVISILRKKRQSVTAFWIEVEAERAPQHPKVYTDIKIHFHVQGRDINPAAVERAIELSENVYCSATVTLRASAKVSTSYSIHPEEGGPEGTHG